jgi:hypothetical protein
LAKLRRGPRPPAARRPENASIVETPEKAGPLPTSPGYHPRQERHPPDGYPESADHILPLPKKGMRQFSLCNANTRLVDNKARLALKSTGAVSKNQGWFGPPKYGLIARFNNDFSSFGTQVHEPNRECIELSKPMFKRVKKPQECISANDHLWKMHFVVLH